MSFTWFRNVFLAWVAVFFVLPSFVFSQPSHVVSGRIHDAETGETLIGASIRLQDDSAVGTRTNNYGFFSLTIETGMQVLVISHVGYLPDQNWPCYRSDGALDAAVQTSPGHPRL